jgi:hypothetical protein
VRCGQVEIDAEQRCSTACDHQSFAIIELDIEIDDAEWRARIIDRLCEHDATTRLDVDFGVAVVNPNRAAGDVAWRDQGGAQ